MNSYAHTPLSSHSDIVVPVEWQPIRSQSFKVYSDFPSTSKQIILIQFLFRKGSGRLFSHCNLFILTKCYCRYHSLLTTSFFLFSPSVWEFQSGTFICHFKGKNFVSTGLTVVLFWCNWNKTIWPQSFEKLGRNITEQTNFSYFVSFKSHFHIKTHSFWNTYLRFKLVFAHFSCTSLGCMFPFMHYWTPIHRYTLNASNFW